MSQTGIIASPTASMRAEFVVIGSGPGGATAASILAEAGRDVLVVEEGGDFSDVDCAPFSLEEMAAKYRNGGLTPTLGRTKVAYVEGCCVGGGSEINSGLYHRTPPEVMDRWRREFQLTGVTPGEMEPHFSAVEKDLSVSLMPTPAPPTSLKLHDGAQKLGWKSLEVPRWFKYESDGSAERQTMSRTYVPRALAHGARLLPRTRVFRLRRKNGSWLIEARHRVAGSIEINAEKVVVSAGAVHTPLLLRRSGITRNVGNSLRLHPTVKIVAEFDEPVNFAGVGVPVHQVKEFAPELSFGCSISSPAYLALALLDHPAQLARVASRWQHMAIFYAMTASESAGSVRALPGCTAPLVRYQPTAHDLRVLADGLRKLGRLLFASGAVRLFPATAGIPSIENPSDLARIPAELPAAGASLMTIHLFSSCPMGEDTACCATDSLGRVHGFDNLFVADASLLPTAPGVNPQGSVMAMVRRNVLGHLNTE